MKKTKVFLTPESKSWMPEATQLSYTTALLCIAWLPLLSRTDKLHTFSVAQFTPMTATDT